MEDLEDLTVKILKSSSKFTSNGFIKSYNIIYLHCTEKTQTYEIKGIVVYETLQKVLTNYFKSLRPITSLQGFYELNQKLEKSYVILERVYFYLERFFIKVNIKKRGSNVVNMRTLFYDLLYKHFMYSCMSNLIEYFIYEIGELRESYFNGKDPENLAELSKSVFYIRNLFFYSENQPEYEHFLEMYYTSFEMINKDNDIQNIIKKTNIELKVAKVLFEFTNKESYFEITKIVAKNFKKFIDWFFRSKKLSIDTMDSPIFLRKYKKIDMILYYMDHTYVCNFFSKLEPFILEYVKKLETIESIFSFFLEFKDTFKSGGVKTDTLENSVEKEIIEKIRNMENVPSFFSKLIKEHTEMKFDCDSRISYIFYLTNLINQKNDILKKLSQDCLERIINDTTGLDLELKIFRTCETYCGASGVSWLKLILQNYGVPIEQDFGLGGQDFDFKTNLRLITKGFCNLETYPIVLHPKLSDLRDILLKRVFLKYPRSDIDCCFTASPLIFEIGGLDIRMSTDKVSILMYLSDDPRLEKVRSLCKDPCYDKNIMFLGDCGLINIIEDKGFINTNTDDIIIRCKSFNEFEYNPSDTSPNSSVDDKSHRFINLFDYKFKEKAVVETRIEGASSIEPAIESLIMKLMKKMKKSTMKNITEEVLKTFGSEIVKLDTIFNKLATKGYINITNDTLVYIP